MSDERCLQSRSST